MPDDEKLYGNKMFSGISIAAIKIRSGNDTLARLHLIKIHFQERQTWPAEA